MPPLPPVKIGDRKEQVRAEKTPTLCPILYLFIKQLFVGVIVLYFLSFI